MSKLNTFSGLEEIKCEYNNCKKEADFNYMKLNLYTKHVKAMYSGKYPKGYILWKKEGAN